MHFMKSKNIISRTTHRITILIGNFTQINKIADLNKKAELKLKTLMFPSQNIPNRRTKIPPFYVLFFKIWIKIPWNTLLLDK